MTVEPSRLAESFWHVWTLPTGMRTTEAREWFERHKQPRGYTFEQFAYNPRTGVARTI